MPKPFQKGDIRINRAGRPKKGQALTDILNSVLDFDHRSGKTKRQVIAEKLVELALKGDMAALKYIFDRCDGRPRETVQLIDAATENKLREILNGRK